MTIYMFIGIIVFIISIIYIVWLSNQEEKNGTSYEHIQKSEKTSNQSIFKEDAQNVIDKIESQKETLENKTNIPNKVASKFEVVVNVIQVVGYTIAILGGLWLMVNVNFWSGLITAIGIAVCVFFSTLLYEAIAEIINLLHDIKNKM